MASNVVAFPGGPSSPDLLEEIRRREDARLAGLSKAYARSVPIASDIDPDSCLRRQVHQIVSWQAKPLAEPYLQARFEVGNLWEREGIAKLLQLGFEVVEQQVPFELRRRGGGGEVAVRGKIDGKIRWGGRRVPFEIKSLHPNIWAQLNTMADFDRWGWASRYPTQLQAYLIGESEPDGFFWITDCLGHWKSIRAELDLELAERIWSFGEAVHDGVVAYRRDGTLPGFSKDPTECLRCEFFKRTCQPDILEQGAAVLADPDLLADLERREALIAAGAKELDRVDKAVKDRLKAAIPAPLPADDETFAAYAARLKAAGPLNGLAGRFLVTIGAKFVKGDENPKPRLARIDRVVSIEAMPGEAVAPVTLDEQLRASLEQKGA